MRYYSFLDRCVFKLETILSIFRQSSAPRRATPAANLPDEDLDQKQRKHSAALMRVNHVGELCAQALYQGQNLMARSAVIRRNLQKAAQEEEDHLYWCEQRLRELNGRPSYLNGFWYFTSLCIGLSAGLLGDKMSLGFLAETEHQVVEHLTQHLLILPLQDKKSRAIIKQMCIDEREHAFVAKQAGAATIPLIIRQAMGGLAKFMTSTAYYI